MPKNVVQAVILEKTSLAYFVKIFEATPGWDRHLPNVIRAFMVGFPYSDSSGDHELILERLSEIVAEKLQLDEVAKVNGIVHLAACAVILQNIIPIKGPISDSKKILKCFPKIPTELSNHRPESVLCSFMICCIHQALKQKFPAIAQEIKNIFPLTLLSAHELISTVTGLLY